MCAYNIFGGENYDMLNYTKSLMTPNAVGVLSVD